jgi:hypothetical protein
MSFSDAWNYPTSFSDAWEYPNGDPSILLFDRAVRAGWIDLPRGARVLELGCCETDFSDWLLKADPTIQLTGVDVNDPQGFKGTFIKGAAEQQEFLPDSFEAVICLGSLEHFGLGFYGDPINAEADVETAMKVHGWLVPGGWWYYDVPWTPMAKGHYVTENNHFRVYDDSSIVDRLDIYMSPRKRMYAHGETNAHQPIRPDGPTTPFWYLQRLVEKDA